MKFLKNILGRLSRIIGAVVGAVSCFLEDALKGLKLLME